MQGQPQYEVQVQVPIHFTHRPREENRVADGASSVPRVATPNEK